MILNHYRFGQLMHWEDWKFIMLFLAALFCPFVWVYLTLGVKNKYNHIPIIKFICRIVSHLYYMFILILTVVIPWKHSTENLLPRFYEWFLLLWLFGMLVAEITRKGERSGMGWIPVIILVLGIVLHKTLRLYYLEF